jgi:hypothetical protein
MTDFKTTREIISLWFRYKDNKQWLSREDHEKEISKIEDEYKRLIKTMSLDVLYNQER